MSEVIYRKYRPQRFSDLTGQEPIKKTLENEIKTGKISHAYLFTGPRGLGKTTTARLIAKAVNCLNRKEEESEPCNQCQHCRAVIAGNFLDLIEIDAASHTGVDNVREVIVENIRFSPNQGKFKVFIIDEAHMLSDSAFNALLKTLEEPPAHAIFILCTTEPHKILETIISRCQRFDFKKVTIRELVSRLEKITKAEQVKVDREVLEIIASRSDGCLRDAENLLQQIFSLGEKEITLKEAGLVLPRSDLKLVLRFTENLFQNDVKSALDLINNLTQEGLDLERFTADTIEFLRQILVFKTNPNLIINAVIEVQAKLKDLTGQIENSRLTQLIELFLQKRQNLKQTEIPQLPLELLVLEFCESNNFSNKVVNNVNKVDNPASVNNVTLRHGSESSTIEQYNPPTGDHPKGDNKKGNTTANPPVSHPNPQPNKANSTINNQTIKQSNNSKLEPINLDKIKECWPSILAEIQKSNHSICAFLKTSQIIAVKSDAVELAFLYKFHQDTIKNEKNRKIIEDCILKITGQQVKVEAKYVPSQQSQNKALENLSSPVQNFAPEPNQVKAAQEDELINDMLAEFGGEVVE